MFLHPLLVIARALLLSSSFLLFSIVLVSCEQMDEIPPQFASVFPVFRFRFFARSHRFQLLILHRVIPQEIIIGTFSLLAMCLEHGHGVAGHVTI